MSTDAIPLRVGKTYILSVMNSNNRHRQIVADIEAELYDLDRRLKGLSPAEKKKLMADERDGLMALVRETLGIFGQIPILGDLLTWALIIVLRFFGFDPFRWCYFEEYDHNPGFANRASSNPSLYDALEQAGQILEKNGSPHLKRISRHFYQKVGSNGDVDIVAGIIIDFCSCLSSAMNGADLRINVNDVKRLLADCINFLLTYKRTEERVEIVHSSPLVLPSGELCWVKYEFVSNTSLETGCCFADKFVNMDVTIWYYWFPSESDFRVALRNIERDK